MQRILKESGYKHVIKRHKETPDWDSQERLDLNPEEEIKLAFTKMTNQQLEFHQQLGGKNKQYAETLLKHRRKNSQT